MFRSIHPNVGLIVGLCALAAACSAAGGSHMFTTSTGEGAGGGGSVTVGSGSGATSGNGASTSTGQGTGNVNFSSGVGTGGQPAMGTGTGAGKTCKVTDPNADMDGDGWTPNQGDCNDCDPNVNPGAVDVPGDPNMVDSDCSGKYDPPTPCDTGLQLDDVDPENGAKAIELCQFTTETPATPKQKIWGVTNAAYVRANGAAFAAPNLQVGLQQSFGTNVHPQGGATMLMLSSGNARVPGQPGACGSNSCSHHFIAAPPAGYPQNNPNCPPSPEIFDDIAFQVTIRSPTNATGYSFAFKFYSMEYPYWVCNNYNDQFIALVSPAPAGALNGNISFDSMHNPVSVNLGFFNVCDPTQIGKYASSCKGSGAKCPSPPNPYCPSGTAELQGTGFDVWDTGYGNGGGTSWLTSQAPVKGGEDITIRFAMWDTGDTNFDSSTLVDDFQWIATPGTSVSVSTTPIPNPT
jgi:hypothetical protein